MFYKGTIIELLKFIETEVNSTTVMSSLYILEHYVVYYHTNDQTHGEWVEMLRCGVDSPPYQQIEEWKSKGQSQMTIWSSQLILSFYDFSNSISWGIWLYFSSHIYTFVYIHFSYRKKSIQYDYGNEARVPYNLYVYKQSSFSKTLKIFGTIWMM